MNEIKTIKLSDISVSEYQPRTHFNEMQIHELAISIKENGLVQPITLRQVNDTYILVAGERRMRAALFLGWESIPAYIIDINETTSMHMSLIENIQREDLSAIEEAKAYIRIMEQQPMTQSELAKRIGKSQSSVANKIRLLQLNVNLQNAIEEKVISERHARALLHLSETEQNEMLEQIIKENLNVAQTEAKVNVPKKKVKLKTKGYARELQIGINTVKRACEMIEKNGLQVAYNEEGDGKEVTITIKLTT